MKVTTENVLGTIGAKAYNSGLLSTYSFEPSYFELRVMSTMRRLGVRNVLTLVDQGVLDGIMESPSASFLDPHGSFGLLPMASDGLYHPKLILLAGESQGFLAMGSGNLTSAGQGTNAELWSLLHVQDFASENARLFVNLWDSMRSECLHAKGVLKQRLDWFEQHAPWMIEVRSTPARTGPYEIDGARIELITPRSGPALATFFSAIGNSQVERFTIISPYFDKHGSVVAALLAQHGRAVARVVVEDRWGSYPTDMAPSVAARCTFYRWKGPKTDDNATDVVPARLHAKLIVAHLGNGGEVLLLGSSNASLAGLGTPNTNSLNKEVNLIIRKERSDILDDLGLSLHDADTVALSDLPSSAVQEPSATSIEHKPIRISLVEHEHPTIWLYLNEPWAKPCSVLVEETDGTTIHEFACDELSETPRFDLFLELPLGCFVRVRSAAGTPLSNRMPVQPVIGHQRCDPDRKYAKLESVLADVDPTELGHIEALLSFADLGFDEGSNEVLASARPTARRAEELHEGGEVMSSYDEFMDPARSHVFRDSNLALSPNVRIADFLSGISRRQLAMQADIDQLEQLGDAVEHIPAINTTYTPDEEQAYLAAQDKERRAIHRFLKRYSDWLTDRIDKSKELVSVIDLSNFLIASYLVLLYAGRRFKRKDGSWIEDQFFLDLKGRAPHKSLKAFCWSTIGDLGILLQRDLRTYSSPSMAKRVQDYLEEAVLNALACACRTYWSNSDRSDVDLIMVNILLSRHGMSENDLSKRLNERMSYGRKDIVLVADVPKNLGLSRAMYDLASKIASNEATEQVSGSALRKGQWFFRKAAGIARVVHSMKYDDHRFKVSFTRPALCASSEDDILREKFVRVKYVPFERV